MCLCISITLNQLKDINMATKEMNEIKMHKVKNHIKMYADDEFLQQVKDEAAKQGIPHSTLILLTMKNRIKKGK